MQLETYLFFYLPLPELYQQTQTFVNNNLSQHNRFCSYPLIQPDTTRQIISVNLIQIQGNVYLILRLSYISNLSEISLKFVNNCGYSGVEIRDIFEKKRERNNRNLKMENNHQNLYRLGHLGVTMVWSC